ncbi:MAG: DUF1080 domain-containing protein [Opitutales bacterium]|jgi:hypothetical protein|nr:DUF1080 domain-containing protein [Opitutales bacterium]MDP4643410.1 DUF1080 domain-containing protein [Opitutales bacterium]MDP4693393.1 DUF1080 domain-containing protein [Opitutales bacterium]MDP4777776.1 DUF1080 domain-containing protein [Opitutales bacterium]MDP4884002.1 DUF1080 domain-containing protein [Opitutales bacterium]
MKNTKYWISLLTTVLLTGSTSIAGEWIELFNGKDLTNWENPYDWGQAKVVDGELHLTTEKSKWFLSTEKEYSDFIFEAEVKMPEGKCNSGFLFRSHKSKNKMFGYQAEVDPSSRNWSGGLYDEGRRRWFISPNRDHAESKEEEKKSITAFLERAGDSFKRHDWNHYRIECRGDHIQIFVNGVMTTDIHDKEDAKGYIALQHHGEDGQVYRFRNIKIMELTDGYEDLFSSGDFSKWTTLEGHPVTLWTINDGVVERPELKPGDKRPGPIITKNHYKEFDLKFDWKISAGGNSGVKYRTQGHLGLEYQVLDDGVHKDSNLSAGIYALVPANEDKPYNPGEQWNSGRIVVKGNHVEHYINGVKVAEVEVGSDDWVERFEKSKYKKHEGFGTWTGPIYLQDHSDPVSFRNFRIKEL